MTQAHIRQSIEGVTKYFGEHPEKAQSTDRAATAVIEEGLRCRVSGPRGETVVSDMPKGIGGAASAPPGPLSVRIRVLIAADDTPAEQLHEIVAWAERHSPVGDAIRRAVPSQIEVAIG